ncbi:MAG: hypothetical protein ACRCWG_06505 [Sarcina sp.]
MKDICATVVEYQTTYEDVDLDLMNKSKEIYDLAILKIHTVEIKNGMLVKRIYKTSNQGTKVIFKRCTSQEEADEYSKMVNEKIKEYKEKYNK